jgi:hypothetical protein
MSGGPSFRLEFGDGAIAALMDRTDRGAQNAFKRGMRAALRVFREAAAGLARARHFDRWTDPNRGFRTSVDTRLTYAGAWQGQGRARRVTGFSILGKLFSRFPGNVFESGQREHWIKVTPALLRWARRKGIPARVLQRRGIWLSQRGAKSKAKWATKGEARRFVGNQRWFVPFSATPDGRLQAWAKSKGFAAKKAILIHDQPPRPFVVPAARQAEGLARTEFARVITEWWTSGRA